MHLGENIRTMAAEVSPPSLGGDLQQQQQQLETRSRERDFYFQHFVLAHDKSALRVCTDSCVFGAYVGRRLEQLEGVRNVLDVGAGCGVLALMIAQATAERKTKCVDGEAEEVGIEIDAVEIDGPSAEECEYNMRESAWSERLRVRQCAVQEYAAIEARMHRYQLVVSNPPFYPVASHSNGKDSRRNTALRTNALSFEALLQSVAALLSPDGLFMALLPPKQAAELRMLAPSHGLYGIEEVLIRDQPSTEPHRSISSFKTSPHSPSISSPLQFSIKAASLEYSDDFRSWLADYYLPDHLLRTPGQKIGHPNFPKR